MRVAAWVLVTVSALSGCSCGGGSDGDAGDGGVACSPEEECGGVCCDEAQVCNADTQLCEVDCAAELEACGVGAAAICCAAGDFCADGACVAECGALNECGNECCSAEQVCAPIGDSGAMGCVAMCEQESQRCGASLEICCSADELCLGNACEPLGDACEVSEECPVGFYCLPSEGRCISRDAVNVCEFMPPVGPLQPEIGCEWRPEAEANPQYPLSAQVVMTPSVANLTDDNGDGVTDTKDIPDLVFVSFDRSVEGCCTANGILRIVSGECDANGRLPTIATLYDPNDAENFPSVGNSTGIALGNLHPDSMTDQRAPEIVATEKHGGTIAWTRVSSDGKQWAKLWYSPEPGRQITHNNGGAAQPFLVDLDKDGAPEVVIGNVVLNGLTGAVKWDGRVTVPGGGIGINAFLGPNSTAADIDVDGYPEVIAGNTVYDGRTGAEKWTYTYVGDNSACGAGTGTNCDGFNAVGNFDADDEGEVVIVRRGEVFVLEHDGTLKHRVAIPVDDAGANESGPPTIADFDGDGRAEVGTAGADFYVVVDFDCLADPLPAECDSPGILWKVANDDDSSRSTGSSVFDFEGDGSAEVVYADETSFRVFDGKTGTVLLEDLYHYSNTRMEMPVIADIDNDGKTEIVIPAAPKDGELDGSGALRAGIVVWEAADNNWVRTRRIWNQHSYHVTNISEDGQVPRYEEPNWLNGRLNNFRQNVQPDGLFDAPDLVVVGATRESCSADGSVQIGIEVRNDGAIGVAPGIPIYVTATKYDGTGADVGTEVLGVAVTKTRLLPGQSEVVLLDAMFAGGFADFATFTVHILVDDDGMGGSVYNECLEDNNDLTSEPFAVCALG